MRSQIRSLVAVLWPSWEYRRWLRPVCTQGPHSPHIAHNLHSDPSLYYNLLPCRVFHSCSDDGRGTTLAVGHLASPSSSLGRNRTPGLHQVPNDFFCFFLKYFAALKTPSLLRIVFLATTQQSGMWMQTEIPAYRLRPLILKFILLLFQYLPGFCYKIQRCQGRGCPVQDQDRFFKLPTGYLPRWMVWSHQGPSLKIISGMGVPEQGKWEEWILFHHFNFHRYSEVMNCTLKQ